MKPFEIGEEHDTLEEIFHVAEARQPLELGEIALQKIQRCRDYLDSKMNDEQATIYGVNTGFGALCDTKISASDLEKLQENLVMSHACGTGDKVPREIIRLMLLLKVKGLAFGHSGVSTDTVNHLVEFYNRDALPVIYEMGSLGASGDLAPLAHLSLPLLGLGEMWYEGEILASEDVLPQIGLKKHVLRSKEGLALLNGTQFMSAYGVYCVQRGRRLSAWADVIGALSLDAFDGRIEPFHEAIQRVRNQRGQQVVAERFRKILNDSQLVARKKEHVQDPYSFRCMPQVHGAVYDSIEYVGSIVENEINAVTDNPTVFPDLDEVISAGNFHGEPLALVLDQYAIAMSELGSISERRTFKLLSGKRGLPPFLAVDPGLNSGFMIPQYTAAAMASQNKQYSTPASVDSIDSSNGQEDHVSMGANSAVKAKKVLDNVNRILAIELLTAAQALDHRVDDRSSTSLEALRKEYRNHVPFVSGDVTLYPHIEATARFIENNDPHQWIVE